MLKKERNTIKYRKKHWKFSLVITYRDGFVLLHKTGNNPCSRSINAVAGQQQSILNLNTSLVINTLECYMCSGSSIFPGSNIQLNNSPMGKYPDNSYYTSATASSRYAGHCWQSKNEKWVTYFYGCQDIHGSSKARQWIKTYMHIFINLLKVLLEKSWVDPNSSPKVINWFNISVSKFSSTTKAWILCEQI